MQIISTDNDNDVCQKICKVQVPSFHIPGENKSMPTSFACAWLAGLQVGLTIHRHSPRCLVQL